MTRTAVINVVGLTDSLLGPATPTLKQFREKGEAIPILPTFPALTCPAQSTYLTGLTPAQHGIVGNGWYNRELAEVQFWKQSNHLVQGRKVWEDLRASEPTFRCAKLFWWYNMYSGADYSVTPRPIYPADGRKVVDIYSHPAALSERLKSEIGDFPFFHFWGPQADILSSEWIAESSMRVFDWHHPTLTLIYLPHLD